MAARAAGDVPYANAESGLGATTVQAAIDEIGTTLESATAGGGVVTGGAARSTTWTMEVVILDVNAEQLTSTSMGTLTLTATAPGQGSYETSGANIFILDGLTGEPRGTKTGKYFVVGDTVMLTGERAPGDQDGVDLGGEPLAWRPDDHSQQLRFGDGGVEEAVRRRLMRK